jgi:hypothetical protein
VRKKIYTKIIRTRESVCVCVCVCVFLNFAFYRFFSLLRRPIAANNGILCLYTRVFPYSRAHTHIDTRYARRIEFPVNSVPFDCVVLTDSSSFISYTIRHILLYWCGAAVGVVSPCDVYILNIYIYICVLYHTTAVASMHRSRLEIMCFQ